MLISVDAARHGPERLAAIGGAEQADAEHVKVFVVAGIDADLAEVHGARIQAVDARPGLAAIRRTVDTAELVTVGPLLVLGILALAAKLDAERPIRINGRAALGLSLSLGQLT